MLYLCNRLMYNQHKLEKNMVYINRLKNGIGEEKDYYIPKNCRSLIMTQPFAISDELVSESLKNSNLKLMFYPNVYTIKRDAHSGEIALKDISEQSVPLPTTLASFRLGKTSSEIVFNGFMLCIDKELEKNLSSEDKLEIEKISKHFGKLKAKDMIKTAHHELKHAKNALVVSDVHQDGSSFNEEFFIRKCFLDEISASCNEVIGDTTSKEEAKLAVKKTFNAWMNKPSNCDTYYGPNGDFNHQWGRYEDQNEGRSDRGAETMYLKLAKEFFTFEIRGEQVDLSNAIDPYFTLPQNQNLTPKLCLQHSR